MNRRGFLKGLIAVTAPAIVPIGSLMPVKLVDFSPETILDEFVAHQMQLYRFERRIWCVVGADTWFLTPVGPSWEIVQ